MFSVSYFVNRPTSSTIPLGGIMVFNATVNNVSVISYIVVVSFIGEGNWSSRRKPLTYFKSLTNFIT
jgi:hypothetical protein